MHFFIGQPHIRPIFEFLFTNTWDRTELVEEASFGGVPITFALQPCTRIGQLASKSSLLFCYTFEKVLAYNPQRM